MDNNKIKVNVFVAGQRFNILTDKSEKYVLDIASEIDARINSLVLTGNMTRERAAVLTALDYADDSVLDKENMTAVKEQMKDYLQEIERLQDNNAKLTGDYNLLKAEYERLIAEQRSAESAQKELTECKKQLADMQAQLDEANAQIEELKSQPPVSAPIEEAPLPEAPPAAEAKPITAEDDLFFEPEEEAPIKPEKKKKNRHDHNHVNPYQQKAKAKEQKGYTQQRQYSFFDVNEE